MSFENVFIYVLIAHFCITSVSVTCYAKNAPANKSLSTNTTYCGDGYDCNNPHENCIPPQTFKNGRIIDSYERSFSTSRKLDFYCNENYGVFPPVHSVWCSNSTWDDKIPECLRLCLPRVSTNVDFTCEKNDLKQDCSNPVVEGTLLTMQCKSRYNEANPLNRPSIECTTNCGQIQSEVTPYVVNGKTAENGEFPWHVAIYRKTPNDPHEYTCGGSIINPNIVLTAAHCFLEVGEYDKKDFCVVAGKFYRIYDAPQDKYKQKREIKDIRIPLDYKGFSTDYSADLAVVIVVTPFEMSNIVLPICLDWTNIYEKEQLQPGVLGKIRILHVAGWGFTEEGKLLASELKRLTVPFVDREECREAVPKTFYRFITFDKICSGYRNGSSVCNGDSGGGLVFYHSGEKKYYLRGLVSIGPGANATCDSHNYATYTLISHHINYIRPAAEESSGKCRRLLNETISTSVSTCRNGSWDLPLLECLPECGQPTPQDVPLIIGGNQIKVARYPWIVGLYRSHASDNTYKFICIGTIISRKVVLSTARCFEQIPVNEIFAAAGKYYKDYTSPNDILAQKRQLANVVIAPEWEESDGNKYGNLGLGIIEQLFDLTNFVQPACVDWFNNIPDNDSSSGLVIGWDRTYSENASEEIQQNVFPYCDRECNVCNYFEDVFCVTVTGNQNSKYEGSGLFVYNSKHEKYYIRGIKSFYNSGDYSLFTNISKYVDFLREVESMYME